ncbi:hypothetical protein G5C01_06165 [Moraxella bovoculi]|uniref:hypothetical protein n=1 Tax=Moraxella bovoculi TaxID=386891 RepID=UPI00156E8703|nr:hypothetical protein [Moraxella bovoculi]NSM10940.1 hypothetical protein [Moraxella bovoculi]
MASDTRRLCHAKPINHCHHAKSWGECVDFCLFDVLLSWTSGTFLPSIRPGTTPKIMLE